MQRLPWASQNRARRQEPGELPLPMIRKTLLLLLPFVAGVLARGASPSNWKMAPCPLVTRWASAVSADNPLPDYPRPQMTRSHWMSLNGLWDYTLTGTDSALPPASYTGKILVPFPYESALSGVGGSSPADQRLWYHRTFTVPASWAGKRTILHFGAVNWKCLVLVNGQIVATHRGGYTAFETDLSKVLVAGSNDITISVQNPLQVDQEDAQVLGKQRQNPNGIFYTACTGIWQTVWLEPVPENHIVGLRLTPDVDKSVLHLTVEAETGGAPAEVLVKAQEGEKLVAQGSGSPGSAIDVPIPDEHLWSPQDPHLYNLSVSLVGNEGVTDSVESYFAMRKVSLGKDEKGRTRICLNNHPLLEIGLLDQGYWPEGVYTAPTDEALASDIRTAKRLGYNLLRKHAKVEPARWYYWADRLGMLVWQDMPQAFGGKDGDLSVDAKMQWLAEWKAELAEFYNTPSIIVWTTFNEGWGQHDTEQIVALTKQLDPTRLVNNASGWNDKKVGDIADTHAYPGPWSGLPEANRAAVDGEFGGVTESIDGHRWAGNHFGYGTVLHDKMLATKRYVDLLKEAYHLSEERGTSAFVYTQLTDVEQEINGILTYDRAVTKFDEAAITAANQGQFPPTPAAGASATPKKQ